MAKDAAKDRLILDARPANCLESFRGRWVYALASATILASIILQPSHMLVFAGTDLRDCFHQFIAPPQHVLSNLLVGAEATRVFGEPCPDAVRADGLVRAGLRAVCSPWRVAESWSPGELLVQAAEPPRGLLSVGLVIDDLVILEQVAEARLCVPGASLESSRRLEAALMGSEAAPLAYNPKKTFKETTEASFWGVSCCGRSGLAGKFWPLVLLTSRVLQLGLVTRSLLESLLGGRVPP